MSRLRHGRYLLLAALLLVTCVDGDRVVDPDDGAVELAHLTVEPTYAEGLAVGETAPIHRIRLVARHADTNRELATDVLEVDPEAASWSVSLSVPLEGVSSLPVIVTIELIHVSDAGGERVEWSGETGVLRVSDVEPANVGEVELGRGSLENLRVASVRIVEGVEELREGESHPFGAEVEGVEEAEVFWGSTDPSVARVSEDGVVEGALPGTAGVVAVAGSRADTALVQVTQRIETLEVDPGEAELEALSREAVFSATALDPRGEPVEGAEISWETGAPEVAESLGEGRFRAVSEGVAPVLARAQDVEGEATLTVRQRVSTLGVEPGSAVLSALGATETFSVDAADPEGFAVAEPGVAWSSSDPEVATVDAEGEATATGVGEAFIIARTDEASDSATLVVEQRVEVVRVSPEEVAFTALGRTRELTVEGVDANGNPIPELSFEWSSSEPDVATVDQDGTVTSEGEGEATVTARARGVEGSARVTVRQEVVEVEITPSSTSVSALGRTRAFRATATDPEGEEVEGASFTWSSSETDVATIDGDGVATAVGVGETTITAEARGEAGTATFRVSQSVADVEVEPASATIFVGETQDFEATVTDATGHRVAGATVSWSSSSPGVATVDASGTATGVGPGTTTITAQAGGREGTATLTVRIEEEILFEGSITIQDPQDLESFEEEGWTRITGDLVIQSSPSTALAHLDGMESLVEVEGGVSIVFNDALSDIGGLQGLTIVGEDLLIQQNEVLPNLDGFGAASLREVGGSLRISFNPSLTSVAGLSSLERVGLDFDLVSNASLPAVTGLSALVSVAEGPCIDPETGQETTVCGNLSISLNPELAHVNGFSALQTIGGGLVVSENLALGSLNGFSSLQDLGGMLAVSENGSLTSVAGLSSLSGPVHHLRILSNPDLGNLNGLGGISEVTGHLRIEDNASLTDVSGLSGVGRVHQMLRVMDNPVLGSLQGMTGLSRVDGALVLINNPQVNSLSSFPSLTRVEGLLRIENNPATVLGLPALEHVGKFVRVWHDMGHPDDEFQEFFDAPVLRELSLPSLQCAGGFVMIKRNYALERLDLSGYQEFTKSCAPDPDDPADGGEPFFLVQDHPELTDLDLSSLRRMAGTLRIEENPSLTSLDLGALEEVEKTLRILNNEGLQSLDLSSLVSVAGEDPAAAEPGGFVFLRDLPSLSSLSVGSLQEVENFVDIRGTALTDLPPMSLAPDATLFVRENPNLTSLSGLAGVTELHTLSISFNPALTDLSALSSLQRVEEDLVIEGNEALETLAGLDNLQSVGVTLRIIGNTSLESFGTGLQSLQSVGGGTDPDRTTPRYFVEILDNPALTSIDLPALAELDDAADLRVERNEVLTDLDGMSALSGTIRNLKIDANISLVDVMGLSGLEEVRNFTVTNNVELTNAGAEELRDAIETITGTVTISGNE